MFYVCEKAINCFLSGVPGRVSGLPLKRRGHKRRSKQWFESLEEGTSVFFSFPAVTAFSDEQHSVPRESPVVSEEKGLLCIQTVLAGM